MNRDKIIEAMSKNSQDYWRILKEENEHLIKDCKNKLYNCIEDRIKGIKDLNLENIVIGVTGSDGRLESYRSETDIVILSKEKITKELNQEILKELKPLLIEIKTIEQKLSYYSNDPKRIFPTRMIDFLVLNSDTCNECYDYFMEKFVEEVINDKNIRKSVSERLKEYSNINKTGKQRWKGREIEHYNSEEGLFYYDEKIDCIKAGPKYGPLRTIQFYIAKKIMEAENKDVENKKDFYKRLFYILPRTTIERIDFLREQKILDLSKESAGYLKDNYNYFLMLYHKLQEMYFINKDLISIKVHNMALKERIISIDRIISSK